MSPARTERARSEAGFSVVESLVALFVFALAGVALVQLQAHSLRNFTAVEHRALAGIVAQNALVEASAGLTPPELGVRDDAPELGGRIWRRRIAVEPTSDPAMRRVTVLVRAHEGGDPIAQMQGFVFLQDEMPAPAAGPS